jgi:hypothetical protein
MFAEFVDLYGAQILYAIITAVAGYIGIVLKNLVKKYINDKVKKDVAKSAVRFAEQVFRDLHGEEKLEQALLAAAEMLEEKGITISALELRVLVEAAVCEFNDAFGKNAIPEKTESGGEEKCL